MSIAQTIEELILTGNRFDTEKYLSFFLEDAELDDPSVGKIFDGHAEIRDYFEQYFVGYNTQTRIVKIESTGKNSAHVEVAFSGNFPGNHVSGTFDFTFKRGKIARVKADLIH